MEKLRRVAALELIEELAGRGFRLEAIRRRRVIRVSPASELSDDLRAKIMERKPELLALLDPIRPDGPCSDCGGFNYVRPAVGGWECLRCTSLPPERIAASFHGPDKWAGRTEGAA